MSADPTLPMHETLLEALHAEIHVAPGRKRGPNRKKPPPTAIMSENATARLYECGHEVITRDRVGVPADQCPMCGRDKDARYPDTRMRRAVPA